MLEFFRRHRGPFLITLTVIIILAFGVWGAIRRTDMGHDPYDVGSERAFSVYGTEYTKRDMDHIARNLRLAYSLQMYDLAFDLPSLARRQGDLDGGPPTTDFVANLLVLRKQALKYGVAVSDEDARKEFESLPALQKEGKFDPTMAENMLTNLRANGYQAADVMELLKDKISLAKLREIVGSNFVASPLEVEKSYASQQQTIRASLIAFPLEEAKKKVEVKDDDISKYYDQNKETYKTVEKRAAKYVTFERPKADSTVAAEDNQKLDKAWEQIVGDFYKKFSDPSSDFDKLVAEANTEIAAKLKKPEPKKAEADPKAADKDKKSEAEKKPEADKTKESGPAVAPVKVEVAALFEQGTPPEGLKKEPQIIKELFRSTLEANKPSDPIDSSKGYTFLRVTQIEAPKQQELKDVKDKIKTSLVDQKARETLAKAAKEARTALADALKAGKKLDDVAKEKSWKVSAVPEFSPASPPTDNPNSADISALAAKTAVNGVSEPFTSDDGETLVVVTAKEVRKSDTSATQKDSQRTTLTSKGEQAVFKSWFGKLRDDAKVDLYIDKKKAES